MIKTRHVVFAALFLLVFTLSIIFPKHNFWLLIVLIVLVVLWFLTTSSFWKKVDKKVRDDELVGEEEVPQ